MEEDNNYIKRNENPKKLFSFTTLNKYFLLPFISPVFYALANIFF